MTKNKIILVLILFLLIDIIFIYLFFYNIIFKNKYLLYFILNKLIN